jgi:hypothetical protein
LLLGQRLRISLSARPAVCCVRFQFIMCFLSRLVVLRVGCMFLAMLYQLLYMSTVRVYRGADKSLARPTSRCIFFDGENTSFDASLVKYINSTNIPPIVIISRVYKNQNLPSL